MLKLIAGLAFLLVLVVLVSWRRCANSRLCDYTHQLGVVLSEEEEAQLDREIDEYSEYLRCRVTRSFPFKDLPPVKVGDVGKRESR